MDSATGPSSLPTPTLADTVQVVNYIKRVAVSILEEDESPQQSAQVLSAALQDSLDVIRKFVADPQVKSLFVQKISNKGTEPIIRMHSLCRTKMFTHFYAKF